jgi:glutamyl-tRNA synthetase
MKSVIVRFAPSPTGYLHIGNVRTAVLNWLFSRSGDGRMVLRLDDTDAARSTAEYAEAIVEDLLWLGLTHDSIERQSRRVNEYENATEKLQQVGKLYPCYETDAELDRKRKRQLLKGLPPVYDREGLSLSDKERAAFENQGRVPHWRFFLDHEIVSWNDGVRGGQSIDCASLSDPVLIRGDGSYLYTLPSVIDDIDFGITDVIRGEDHVANTAAQIQLFRALDAEPPDFAHHSLLVAADGSRLSKRLGAQSVRDFREDGLEPMSVLSLVSTIGSSQAVAPFQSGDELVELFDLSKLSRAPARFDVEELVSLNGKLLQSRDYTDVANQLEKLEIGGGKPFWLAVRNNCPRIADAADWWRVATDKIDPMMDDAEAEYCAEAAVLLPEETWDSGTWRAWTSAVSDQTKRTGRRLFAPLRLALTGRARGPELAMFLPFIGRDRAVARLTRGSTG